MNKPIDFDIDVEVVKYKQDVEYFNTEMRFLKTSKDFIHFNKEINKKYMEYWSVRGVNKAVGISATDNNTVKYMLGRREVEVRIEDLYKYLVIK